MRNKMVEFYQYMLKFGEDSKNILITIVIKHSWRKIILQIIAKIVGELFFQKIIFLENKLYFYLIKS